MGKLAIGATIICFPITGLTTLTHLSQRMEPCLLKIDPVNGDRPWASLGIVTRYTIFILQWLRHLMA